MNHHPQCKQYGKRAEDCNCTKRETIRDVMMDPERMKAAALEAARFSSFAQRVKMEYWRELKSGEMTVPESTLDTILLHAWEEAKEREQIICSAVVAKDGTIFRGHRHHDALHAMKTAGKEYEYTHESQGFMTSRNRYVNRKEGFEIQKAAGLRSALEGTEHADGAFLHGELYSEDLY